VVENPRRVQEHPEQAKVVVEVSTRYADGEGLKTIAKNPNAPDELLPIVDAARLEGKALHWVGLTVPPSGKSTGPRSRARRARRIRRA
jgi:hypothetical protein